jgi:hypothetical protein
MLSNFLSRFDFSHPNVTSEILFFVAILWLIVVSCTVWSVCLRMRGWPARFFWIAAVVFLPVVGVVAYLPFSMDHDALQAFVRFGRRS